MGEGTSICRGGEQDWVGNEKQGVKKGSESEARENVMMEIRRLEEGRVREREDRKRGQRKDEVEIIKKRQ